MPVDEKQLELLGTIWYLTTAPAYNINALPKGARPPIGRRELDLLTNKILSESVSREEELDLRDYVKYYIPKSEWDAAVNCLLETYSARELIDFYESMKVSESNEWKANYFSKFANGVAFRLRENGFCWHANFIERQGLPLFSAAARAHVEEGKPAGKALESLLPPSPSLPWWRRVLQRVTHVKKSNNIS